MVVVLNTKSVCPHAHDCLHNRWDLAGKVQDHSSLLVIIQTEMSLQLFKKSHSAGLPCITVEWPMLDIFNVTRGTFLAKTVFPRNPSPASSSNVEVSCSPSQFHKHCSVSLVRNITASVTTSGLANGVQN